MSDPEQQPADDVLAYHLAELAVARTPGDPRHLLPAWPAGARAVVDVGCGAGQTLIALGPPDAAASGGAALRCGVDVDAASLALGRTLDPTLVLACAAGEALPFASESFDFVICRVALPYMDVARAVGEMARVLRPGGRIWLALHPARAALSALAGHAARGEPRGALFQLYVLANGAALHVGGPQFRFPLGRRGFESVQTRRGIERALGQAGFADVQVRRDRFFVVTAERAP